MAVTALVLATLIATATPSAAQRERLYTVEDTLIDPSRLTATIDVSGMPGAVRALRVRTPSGALLLSNVRVHYSDGSVFDERRRINLLRGERTRPIDPSREDRFVDKLTLEIDPATASARRVRVQIIAHQTRRGRRLRRPQPATPTSEAPVARQPGAAENKKANIAARDERRERARRSGTILDADREPPPELLGRGEVLFGAQRVGLGLDRDVVRIGANIGKFKRIRLRVLENDVFLNEMTLVYADGSESAIAVAADLERNKTSAWFQAEDNKFIREVRLNYRSKTSLRGRARVELFGEFADGWLGRDGEARRFNDGWVLLGAQTAGFVGFDDDVVPVGRNKGGFTQVRVAVRDRAITLNELQVIYGNGRSDTVPIRTRVNAGSTWGPVDLKGDRRAIREIRARYRSRFFDREAAGRGAAIVEIWGRY
ncbi:MAG: DUF2541 domain-containing protein [Pseudomonadota bacterium]